MPSLFMPRALFALGMFCLFVMVPLAFWVSAGWPVAIAEIVMACIFLTLSHLEAQHVFRDRREYRRLRRQNPFRFPLSESDRQALTLRKFAANATPEQLARGDQRLLADIRRMDALLGVWPKKGETK